MSEAAASSAGGAPCVSVIVAARNAAATLPATLASLVADRALIAEVLLVDDGSTDATAATASECAGRLGLPIEILATAVGDAGAARNLGLERARGAFIFFLDADDEVVAGAIGLLLAALQADPAAGLALGATRRRTAARPDKLKVPHGYGASPAANAVAYLANRLWPIAVGSALVRRHVALSARFPAGLLYDEDTCYWAALLAAARVSPVTAEVLVYNLDEARAAARLSLAPRRNFLAAAAALVRLRAYGIRRAALQRRKAWLALRVARQLVKSGQGSEARPFLRLAAAHPAAVHQWTALRYKTKIATAALAALLSPSKRSRPRKPPTEHNATETRRKLKP